jgi:outer membrane autotransporter protein
MFINDAIANLQVFLTRGIAVLLLASIAPSVTAQQIDEIVELDEPFNVVEGSSITDTQTYVYVDALFPDGICNYTISIDGSSAGLNVSASPLSGVCDDGVNELTEITVGAGTALAGDYREQIGTASWTVVSVETGQLVEQGTIGIVISTNVAEACDVPGLEDLPADDPGCVAANAPPEITGGPTATPNPAIVGQTVNFAVDASDPDGDPLDFNWDFGDGSSTVGQNPAHVYAVAGSYTATVTVSDGELTATGTVSVAVTDDPDVPTDSVSALGFASAPILSLSLNESGGLSARVKDADGVGIPGVQVFWEVSPESGGLEQAASTTNDEGIASNAFTESRAGEYEIIASVPDVEPLTFTVLVGSDIAATPQGAVRSAIFNACPDAQNNTAAFQATCDAVVGADLGDSGDAQTAYFALANDEVATQKRMMEAMMNQQNANVQARLAALRRGARGINVGGFSMNLNGLQLPGNVLLAATNDVGTGADGDVGGGLLGNRLGVFINGQISYGSKDATLNEAGFDFDTGGVTIGADYRFTDDFVAGLALGYANTDVELDQRGGELDSKGYGLSLYGTYYKGDNFFLEGLLGYGKGDLDQIRNARFVVGDYAVDSSFEADPDVSNYAASIGGGYDYFHLDSGLTTTFFARLNYLKSKIDGYSESEVARANLSGMAVAVKDQSYKSVTSDIGLQVQKAFSFDWGVLIPYARAEWEHEFENDAPVITASYLGNAAGAGLMRFYGSELDANYGRVGLGASAQFMHGFSGFVSYDKLVGYQDFDQNDWSFGLRYETSF